MVEHICVEVSVHSLGQTHVPPKQGGKHHQTVPHEQIRILVPSPGAQHHVSSCSTCSMEDINDVVMYTMIQPTSKPELTSTPVPDRHHGVVSKQCCSSKPPTVDNNVVLRKLIYLCHLPALQHPSSLQDCGHSGQKLVRLCVTSD
jgi:hypothetical protein